MITSRKNSLLQQIRKLFHSRKEREEQRLFAGDGVKLLEEALRWVPELLHTVVVTEQVSLPPLPEHVRLVQVPEDIMEQISPMEAPQGALFLCRMPKQTSPVMTPGCLILDGIQDPGNLGTILRTADALQVQVILTPGCADAYNHKTVRAAMGALFRTPPLFASQEEVLESCRQQGIPIYATALSERAADVRAVPISKGALVIGSEGRGIGGFFMEHADGEVIIPMNEKCESLNAAVAAAIVMWEMKR